MSECPFCGDEHPPGPIGEPDSWLAGIEIKACPKIPEGFIYLDDNREPRGQLAKLGTNPSL